MCAFPPETCSVRLWFHDCREPARPVSPNVQSHHAEKPKPILTPWNPSGKPILCDCMIIRAGLTGCLCKKGLFIHSGFGSCAKAPSDLNGSIIRQAAKASFQTSNVRSLPLSQVGRRSENQWIVINLHMQRAHAVQWEIREKSPVIVSPRVTLSFDEQSGKHLSMVCFSVQQRTRHFRWPVNGSRYVLQHTS